MAETTPHSLAEIAGGYLDLSDAELESLLDSAWERTGVLGAAVRGEGHAFWRNMRDELLQRAVADSKTVEVTTALIAEVVLTWASEHGFTAERLTFPLALLVAWVTSAALKQIPRRPGSREPE
jgi:hypothetical protein